MRANLKLGSRSGRKKRKRSRSTRRRREVSRERYWTDEELGERRLRKSKRGRQYIPAQIFTFVGMGLPVGYLLLWHLNAIPSDTDFETTGLCVASLAGATWLTIAMSFYEGMWCNTGLMMYSWVLSILILIANVLIVVVELSDSFQDETEEDGETKDTKWISLGFASSAILVVSSFIFNLVYIYKCVGQKKPQDEEYNSKTTRKRRRQPNGYASEGFVPGRRRGSLRGNRRVKYSYSEDERRQKTSIRVFNPRKRPRTRLRQSNEINSNVIKSKYNSREQPIKVIPQSLQLREKQPEMEITPLESSQTLRKGRGPGSR